MLSSFVTVTLLLALGIDALPSSSTSSYASVSRRSNPDGSCYSKQDCLPGHVCWIDEPFDGPGSCSDDVSLAYPNPIVAKRDNGKQEEASVSRRWENAIGASTLARRGGGIEDTCSESKPCGSGLTCYTLIDGRSGCFPTVFTKTTHERFVHWKAGVKA